MFWVAFASALPDSSEKTRTLRSAVTNWAAGDRVAAISWIEQFSDRKGQHLAQQAVAESWEHKELQHALEWVAGWESTDENSRDFSGSIAGKIITEWTARDPAAANSYLDRGDDYGRSTH